MVTTKRAVPEPRVSTMKWSTLEAARGDDEAGSARAARGDDEAAGVGGLARRR